MGAWGPNPWESDSCVDFKWSIMLPVKESLHNLFLDEILDKDKYDDYRAGAQLLVDLYEADIWFQFSKEEMDRIINTIRIIAQDEEWLSSWCDPDMMVYELGKCIRGLRAITV